MATDGDQELPPIGGGEFSQPRAPGYRPEVYAAPQGTFVPLSSQDQPASLNVTGPTGPTGGATPNLRGLNGPTGPAPEPIHVTGPSGGPMPDVSPTFLSGPTASVAGTAPSSASVVLEQAAGIGRAAGEPLIDMRDVVPPPVVIGPTAAGEAQVLSPGEIPVAR